MREIKFRAWDKKNKMWLNILGVVYDGRNKNFGLHIVQGDTDSKSFTFVGDDIKVMQFTGLKDKNGAEIYESDKLNHNGLEGEVWWNEDLGAWMWADELLGNHYKVLVVVGNKYEQSGN